MRLLFPVLSLALLAAAPLSAAGLAETHQALTAPAGKMHGQAFRPIAPQACAEAKLNPSGSRPATTLPARDVQGCAKTEAAKRS